MLYMNTDFSMNNQTISEKHLYDQFSDAIDSLQYNNITYLTQTTFNGVFLSFRVLRENDLLNVLICENGNCF